MDDRLAFGSSAAFGDWSDSKTLWRNAEKYRYLKWELFRWGYGSNHSFQWTWYWDLRTPSSQLGLAEVTIDGKSVGELDSSARLEAGCRRFVISNLSPGPHLMTITVSVNIKGRGSERSKISLDTSKVFPGQGEQLKKIRPIIDFININTAQHLKTGLMEYASTESMQISMQIVLLLEATAKFILWYRYSHGLKTSALGKALVTRWKEMQTRLLLELPKKELWLAIHESVDGGVLALKSGPRFSEGRKKISLDSFDVQKLHQCH